MSAIGTQFEKLFSKLFKQEKVKGSGNQPFAKLDIKGNRLLLSLKATQAESFRVTKKDLDEAKEMVFGPGGLGNDYIPGMVVCLVQGDEPQANDPMYIILEMNDQYQLLQEQAKLFEPDKTQKKIQAAQVPGLFRE